MALRGQDSDSEGVATRDPREHVVVDERPWGRFRQYTDNQATTVKLLTVEAGQSLSLQRHRLRDELWVTMDAGLRVEIDEERWIADEGEELFIPRGATHRVSGGATGGRLLEIAFGEFDEDDIERLEDTYGRT